MLVAVLAGCCGILLVPALVLLAGRVIVRRAMESPLRRLAEWLQPDAAENTAWIVGTVGLLLLRRARDSRRSTRSRSRSGDRRPPRLARWAHA